MSAGSRLTRREIQGVLRALRNMDRKNRLDGQVVGTAGEILSEDEEHAFERDSATDDTRVRTAVAWLEEAALLTREENRVQVFPSSLRVRSIEEATAKLQRARIADAYRRQLLSVVRTLIEADRDEGISTDELMTATGLNSEGVRGALYDLERLGIASNDTVLTAFVHAGVQRASRQRFQQSAALERALIDLLTETAPDMEKGDSFPLHLRLATQRLKDEGHEYALPEFLRRILQSIAADGRDEGGGGGSLGVRGRDRETVQVTLQRDWDDLERMAEFRRAAASRLLDHLLACLPPGSRGNRPACRDDSWQAANVSQVRHYNRKRIQKPKQIDGSLPAVAARAGSNKAEQRTDCVSPGHDHSPDAGAPRLCTVRFCIPQAAL